MRWRFGVDEAHRAEKLREIDAWWATFEAKADDLNAYFDGKREWGLAQWMQDNLGRVDSRIMWEFGPGLRGGHRLVLTPEADRQLRPLVTTILERAPELKGWEFYGYRLPGSADEAERMLKARGQMSLAGATVVVSPGGHNCIDLTFYATEFTGPDDQNARDAAFVATEYLLGEEVLDTWVGVVAVDKAVNPRADAIHVEEMQAAARRGIAGI